jgi:hypothetical protein
MILCNLNFNYIVCPYKNYHFYSKQLLTLFRQINNLAITIPTLTLLMAKDHLDQIQHYHLPPLIQIILFLNHNISYSQTLYPHSISHIYLSSITKTYPLACYLSTPHI